MQSLRINAAAQLGKLTFELYCDETQPKVEEDFIVPETILGENLQVDSKPENPKTIPYPEGGN